MKSIRILLGFIAFCFIAPAQENYYVVSHTASLSSTTDKVTVQQPATGARQIRFRGALVSCSTAATTPCVLTLAQNGTAATATTLAVTPLNLSPPAASTAWSGSNVGTGTVIHVYTLVVGGDYWLDLSQFFLAPGVNSNISLGFGSLTGSTSIAIFYVEL